MYYDFLQMEDIEGEIWRDITLFNGLYRISNLGRVKSVSIKRVDKNGRIYSKKPQIMKQSFTSTGYLKVGLLHKDYKVHRLVAEEFVEKIGNRQVVNHIDNNPLNNVSSNLEWCTQRENIIHARIFGFRKYKMDLLDKQKIYFMFNNKIPPDKIAKAFGCTGGVIRRILNRAGLRRDCGFYQNKYHININELKNDFDQGISNSELSKKYQCPATLIARRKYQYNKGVI